jgi:Na+/H+-dicarboxylate symporter
MQTRPQSVNTLGILNLVFAGLGLIGMVATYAMYFGGLHLRHDPVQEIARSSPTYMSFMRATLVSGTIAAIALGTSGIGLRQMKSWGRHLAIAYSIWSIVAAIFGFYMTHKYLLEPLSHSDNPAAKGGVAGGYMGGLIGLVYPVVLLIFMNKRDVKDAFARANQPPVPPAQLR